MVDPVHGDQLDSNGKPSCGERLTFVEKRGQILLHSLTRQIPESRTATTSTLIHFAIKFP